MRTKTICPICSETWQEALESGELLARCSCGMFMYRNSEGYQTPENRSAFFILFFAFYLKRIIKLMNKIFIEPVLRLELKKD